MNASTHILGGVVATECVWCLVPHLSHPFAWLALSGFGGLLPDWDHPDSTIGRWIPWPAVIQSRGPHRPPLVGRRGLHGPIWHRHQAHSPVGVGLVSALVTLSGGVFWSMLTSWHEVTTAYPWRLVASGCFIGSLSHLVLDGFNDTPQWWAWPISRHGFRWPLHASIKRIEPLISFVLTGIGIVLAWHLTQTVFPQIF
ncbi:metal-dependent hydrolase [Sulfobacillus thermosulfidooxidans]|uniref:metal-dependent hydrolase n=1 Tax=Sulfobacillus thermosulfidooxidans TaxID=28034 RepID=UPI0006B6108A|nr:metal-dependent hydrolase [Sulfobacillus thermosulfidooxidans]